MNREGSLVVVGAGKIKVVYFNGIAGQSTSITRRSIKPLIFLTGAFSIRQVIDLKEYIAPIVLFDNERSFMVAAPESKYL